MQNRVRGRGGRQTVEREKRIQREKSMISLYKILGDEYHYLCVFLL